MQLAIIAAMSENRCIGLNNTLPWNLPDEWAYFRRVTAGKPFLMGRKSFESPDGLYSDTRNVVLSRSADLSLPARAEQARSLEEAFRLLEHESQVFVLGGVGLFETLLPRADQLYLTIVHARVEGDVFFPEVDLSDWTQVYSHFHPADRNHAFAFTMNQYQRLPG